MVTITGAYAFSTETYLYTIVPQKKEVILSKARV